MLEKVSCYVQKARSANSLLFSWQWGPFHVGCLFCMGAYKWMWLLQLKWVTFMGAYFLWVPILLILYSSHLMGSIPLKRLPLHTNTIKHLLHAGEVLRNNQVVWVVYSGTLHGRHPPATSKTVSHVLLFVYSGNPLNGHLSTADTHNITDNSQSPDSPSIHFKT